MTRRASNPLSQTSLPPRLAALVEMMPTSINRLIDVGTDHGQLLIHYGLRQAAQALVGIDIHQGPLNRAKKAIAANGLSQLAEYHLADGLSDDVVAIAGMGGFEILKILSSAHLPIGLRLFVQPMKSARELRLGCSKIGIEITAENLVIDKDHLYVLMSCKKIRQTTPSDHFMDELKLPCSNLEDELQARFGEPWVIRTCTAAQLGHRNPSFKPNAGVQKCLQSRDGKNCLLQYYQLVCRPLRYQIKAKPTAQTSKILDLVTEWMAWIESRNDE